MIPSKLHEVKKGIKFRFSPDENQPCYSKGKYNKYLKEFSILNANGLKVASVSRYKIVWL